MADVFLVVFEVKVALSLKLSFRMGVSAPSYMRRKELEPILFSGV